MKSKKVAWIEFPPSAIVLKTPGWHTKFLKLPPQWKEAVLRKQKLLHNLVLRFEIETVKIIQKKKEQAGSKYIRWKKRKTDHRKHSGNIYLNNS